MHEYLRAPFFVHANVNDEDRIPERSQDWANPGTRATGEEPPAANDVSEVCAARKARQGIEIGRALQ